MSKSHNIQRLSAKSCVVLIVSLAVAWGAAVFRPDARAANPAKAKAVAAAAASMEPKHSPPTAASSPAVQSRAEAKAEPEPPTLDQLRGMNDGALNSAVKHIDDEIAQREYVEHANAGSLMPEEFEHLRALLRQRNSVQIVKAERVLASLETPSKP